MLCSLSTCPSSDRRYKGYADLWNAYTIRRQENRPTVFPGKLVVLYFHPSQPARDYGSEVPNNRLQRLLQTVVAYEPNEYLPAVIMQFCHNIFNSRARDLHLQKDGNLDYTTVIGEPPVAIHRVAYILIRDTLNHYLSDGNELPMCHIPRGAYDWIPPPSVVPPEVDLDEQEPGSIYEGSDGPEYIDWEDRYLDSADQSNLKASAVNRNQSLVICSLCSTAAGRTACTTRCSRPKPSKRRDASD